MPISKGSGLNAEWGESPREPVTVKLQLREISQIRAWIWNRSDASSTVCFLQTEELLPAGGIREAGLCGCRFRYPGKKIHVKCSTVRKLASKHLQRQGFLCWWREYWLQIGTKKPPTRYRIGGRRRIEFCALCADLQNADALYTAPLALKRRMNI